MDFLDPRRRKAHRRRLFIGYVLMSIVVSIGTLVILYLAYGYDIDRKSGDLIQNGIVFVDSQPKDATIYLNDVKQGKRTDTRMVLPAGIYTIRLEAEGYRNWERTFNLDGGQIQRLVYPYLLPIANDPSDLYIYSTLPSLVTQSLDRRWVLVQQPDQMYQFDLFDLNDPTRAPEAILMPLTILTSPNALATLKVVEWASNNRHVLLERQFESRTEFIMFDRENPVESVNINLLLGVTPIRVSLRDQRSDQVYLLDSIPGTLRSADLRNRTLSAPLAQAVLDYKTYEEHVLLYATQENMEAGRTEFRISEKGVVYPLKVVNQADAYVLEINRYENRWYYIVGSAADNMAFVYENPVSSLKSAGKDPLTVAGILRLDNPRFVSFSKNSQFIALQSGSQLLTMDLEDRQQYRLTLTHDISLSQRINWMDGHRFIYVVAGQSYIIDFDGSNEQALVKTKLASEPVFDRNYYNAFTFDTSETEPDQVALIIFPINLNQ